MPKIATLGNIQIWVFNFDTQKHKAPHFHAWSPQGNAVIGIPNLRVLNDSLKSKDLKRALAWASEEQNIARLVQQWNVSNPNQPIRGK